MSAATAGERRGARRGPADARPAVAAAGARRRTSCCCPGLAWLVVLFVLPMLALLRPRRRPGRPVPRSASTSRPSGWRTTRTRSTSTWPQFPRSFGYARIATVAALVIGYPLAYAIAFRAGRWKNLLLVAVIAPFFISFLLRTIAWKQILADEGWWSAR